MKTIAPSAVVALQEALTSLYWYKSDLKRYILNILEPRHLRYVDWNDNKRQIVDSIFRGLDLSSEADKSIVARMIVDISQISDLSHLQKLEDGKLKVLRAREAIQRLSSLARAAEEIIKDTGHWEKTYEDVRLQMDMGVIYQEQMQVLKNRFYAIHSNIGSQSVGYEFEKFIYDLLEIEELNPKAGYKVIGEQIDGAFSLSGTNYIYECKATKAQADTPEILKFRAKIDSKLENTLGLFISVNGFKKDAITAATLGRRANLIFIDASHILASLDMRVSLKEILSRMQRYSSQTGRVYMEINEML